MDQVRLNNNPQTRPWHYAIGMFGTSIPINLFRTYAFTFYVDQLAHITSQQFSLILAIYTFIDAIDNPLYGFFSDRTRTRWGRRRPWLMIGAPLLAFCLIAFFSPPEGSRTALFFYVLIFYILTGTLDSLINTNYGALFPELFPTGPARLRTNAIRQVFQLLAMIISIALTPVIAGRIGYQMTAIAYAALALAVILFMTKNIKEDPYAVTEAKPNLWHAIIAALKNPKFWIYGLTNATFFAAFSILQQTVSLYARYVLDASNLATTILLASVIIVAVLSIPVWTFITKRLTLMPAWRLSFAIVGVSLIPLYFINTLPLSIATLIILGFGYGGTLATMDLVGARILDEDRIQYNVKREGSYTSLLGVLNKSSGLFVAIGFLFVSQFFGYIDGSQPGPEPAQAARFLIAVFPFALLVISFILAHLLKFPNHDRD